MIIYTSQVDGIAPSQLNGFFVGWPNPPNPTTHLRILKQSTHVVLALDDQTNQAVGFINAIGDGILAAYLPLLEVLPEYQGRGIGGELVTRMLARLENLYMVDLVCDKKLMPFYGKYGLTSMHAMGWRHFDVQNGQPDATGA